MSGGAVLLTLLAYAVLMCAGVVLDTLGVPPVLVALVVTAPLILGALAPAWINATMNETDFIAGGRPMAAFAGGAWLAMNALAVVALAALAGHRTGVLPLPAIPLSAIGAIVLAATLLAPAMRASGAATLPGFLARRFDSAAIRLPGAVYVLAICLPLAAMLIQAAAAGTANLLGMAGEHSWPFALVFVAIAVVAVPGGMKGLAASQKILFLLLMLACGAPAAWLLATQSPTLPAAPWTAGAGVALFPAAAMDVLDFVCIAVGAAALPSLLSAFAAAGEKPAASRYLAAALALVLTLCAAAAVLGFLPDALAAQSPASPVPASPVAAGFGALPQAAEVLAGTAALIALAFAAAALLLASANALGRDLYYRMLDPLAPTGRRLMVTRLLVMALAALAAYAAAAWPGAVPQAGSWALALAAAGLFPVLVLAVWWSQATASGAIAGLAAGAVAVAACVAAAGEDWNPLRGFDGVSSATIGLPVCVAAMIAVSLLARRPAREALDGE